jgi:hypothetical protein
MPISVFWGVEHGGQYGGDIGVFRRVGLVVMLVLLVAFAWRCIAPFLHSEPEQDACEFGPVSNARYRELLAEAKSRDGTTWPKLRAYGWLLSQGTVDRLQAGISNRVNDLTRGMTSVYEKLAAMHAVARSLGAFHRSYGPHIRQDFWPLDLPFGAVGFGYEIDIMMFGSSQPFLGTPSQPLVGVARLGLHLGTSKRPARGEIPGKFTANLLWPKWLHPNPRLSNGFFPPPCPPMPSREWAERFDAWAAQLP